MLPLLAASVVVSVGALKSSATTATTVRTSPATSKTLSVLHMVADDLRSVPCVSNLLTGLTAQFLSPFASLFNDKDLVYSSEEVYTLQEHHSCEC